MHKISSGSSVNADQWHAVYVFIYFLTPIPFFEPPSLFKFL